MLRISFFWSIGVKDYIEFFNVNKSKSCAYYQ